MVCLGITMGLRMLYIGFPHSSRSRQAAAPVSRCGAADCRRSRRPDRGRSAAGVDPDVDSGTAWVGEGADAGAGLTVCLPMIFGHHWSSTHWHVFFFEDSSKNDHGDENG